MPTHIEHEFEEIPAVFPNGQKLYCSGTFNISYTMHRGDRDIGEPDRFPEFDITDKWVTVRAFDDDDLGNSMEIRLPWLPGRPGTHDPLGQIWEARRDKINDAIMEHEIDW